MKKKALWGCLPAIVVCVICFYLIRGNEIDVYISVIGSIASLYGIFIAYLQIRLVRERTEETQKAVTDKLAELNKHFSVIDVSRIHSVGKEIQAYIHASKLEVALFRMRDFKDEIVLLRQNQDLLSDSQKLTFNQCVKDIGSDIANLSANYKKKDQVSVDTINEHIDTILTLMSEMAGSIKFKEYDSGKVQRVDR